MTVVLTEDKKVRLEQLHAKARADFQEFLNRGEYGELFDPLERIAYASGCFRVIQLDPSKGTVPFNLLLTQLQQSAREDGRSWSEIAFAMGHEPTRNARRLVARRFAERLEMLAEWRDEDPDGES